MYALYERFLKPTLQPDPSEVGYFRGLMDRYFIHLKDLASRDLEIESEITSFNPLDWLATRDFDSKKKDDYLKTMMKEWSESRVRHGCYETMVKSGEVYYTEQPNAELFMDGDDRPRNIMVGSQ